MRNMLIYYALIECINIVSRQSKLHDIFKLYNNLEKNTIH